MRTIASLVVVVVVGVVACGDGDNLPDSRPPVIDAPPPGIDSATLSARITVTQEANDPAPGTPIADADVLVVGGATFTTGADGVADIIVDNDGVDVWVERPPLAPLVPGGPTYSGRIYYLASIGPGADIHLGGQPVPGPSTDGTVTINYTPFAGATFFEADSTMAGCAELTDATPGQLTYTVFAQPRCDLPARALTITGRDDAGTPVAWLTVPDVAPAPGVIDATAIAWDTTGATYTVDLTGHPFEVISGATVWQSALSWRIQLASGGLTAGTALYAVTDAALALPAGAITYFTHPGASAQIVADPVLALPTTQTIDGGAMLPYIADQRHDPATRTISWSTVTAGAPAPQLVTASFSYFDGIDSTVYRWTIYAPGDATSLVIPEVPDAISGHDLRGTDVVYPDVLLLHGEGGTYANLVADLDLYRDDPAYQGFGAISRLLVSGGYDTGGK